MKITFTNKTEGNAALGMLVPEGKRVSRHPFAKSLSAEDRNYLEALEKKAPVKPGESRTVLTPQGRTLVLLGASKKPGWRECILAARRAVAAAKAARLPRLALALEEFSRGDRIRAAETLGAQLVIAHFEFLAYKTPPPEGWPAVAEFFLYSPKRAKSLADALARGHIIGEEVNAARALSNTPGGDMTPAVLAEAARAAGAAHGIKVTIFDEARIKELKMGGVLGVAKGSAERPRFIVMEYLKGRKKEAPVVIVGKGVTFDTGGLNLKPTQAINEMHMDMSGGAAAIHALVALARLKAKKNLVALIPAVENMPSGSSYHPGDVLRTMNGKTIEVLNTDAEGRIILADALEYAKRYAPRLVIDIATLTGAAMVALGQRASAIFATDGKFERAFREAGEETGDRVWPLPLWEEFEEEMKGTFGDVANDGKSRYGGAIQGAVFLWQFIKGIPWVHIDIAPRMTAIEGEYLAKGAAGASVALLARFLRNF